MQSPEEFYKKQLDKYEINLKKVKKQLFQTVTFRFIVFVVTLSVGKFFIDQTQLLLLILLIGITLFLFLVKQHGKLKEKKEKILALIGINQTEINVIENNAFTLDTGDEYKDPSHKYSYDIDLFGKASFFQYLNRTATTSGKNLLAKQLVSNDILDINEKQNTIKELSEKAVWRQEFTATARIVKVNIKPNIITDWMHSYVSFTPSAMQYLPHLFSGISLLLIVLSYLTILPVSYLILWFFIGFGISGFYYKKITKLAHHANQAKDTFRQYYKLLLQLENTHFEADNLVKAKKNINVVGEKASQIFKKFSGYLDALDQRNNLLVGIFGNGFGLMDLKNTHKIEKWISTYKTDIEKWFDVIAYFDAQNSLGNYHFNHQTHVFATINTDSKTIESVALGHPLLNKEKRIDNDFSIDKKDFFIITGANMAGKSTFLRTVSLSIVMANVGLPVCAKSYNYSPIKLITSMRTTDSLSDDTSYFFSELKRLKFIKDAIKEEKHFIVLDEILKGTNSTDKAIGSRKFVKKLVESKSTGIIATHDLSLCEIESELDQIQNYFFDAEIINDELYFDYKMKTGVCQNMNASFLLKKMGIV